MTSFEIGLKIVECSLADDGHILECALPLSCGHAVCKKCVPANNNYKFLCLKCEKVNLIDLSVCDESLSVKTVIESLRSTLDKKISVEFHKDIEVLKGLKMFFNKITLFIASIVLEKSSVLENKYNAHLDYIESDIETKIESLMNDLQMLRENYNKRITDYRDHIKRYYLIYT